MSQSRSYSQVFMALLAMLLVFTLVHDTQSFRFLMALKVLGWGIVVMLFLGRLSQFLRD